MTGKRFFSDSKSDKDLPDDHRRKRPRISLASVVGEVVMVNSLQNLFSSLEPLLRRVVNEEVEHVLRRCTRSFSRSSSLRIQALEQSSLQLVFSKKLSLPIFTGSKILNCDGNPLQIHVVDKSNGDQMVPISPSQPIKIEVVVLDGDFPKKDDAWTSEQFHNSIVKERTGKRPLLHGDLAVTLRDGSAVIGDIEFTDNSSWIRSRKFRIGVRVVPGANSGLSAREAMTEAFVVKDHRGELYKKHHPPKLEDEVWRLEKIGKEGAFHKKLSSVGINTVQDFLKLSVIDTQKLRKILGVGMSERMWEVTLKHAKTCEMSHKLHIFRGRDNLSIFLNSICQVLKIEGSNGQVYSTREISYNFNRTYIESLVREAYESWNSLEVVDGNILEPVLLTQGDMVDQQYINNAHQAMVTKGFEQNGHQIDEKSMMSVGYFLPARNVQMDCTDWAQVNMPYFYDTVDTINRGSISESSSDGDLGSQGF